MLADSTGHRVTLVSEVPSFDLGTAWDALAPGFIRYNTLSYNAGGETKKSGRGGSFLKGRAVDDVAVTPPLMSWEGASRAHIRYLTSLPDTHGGRRALPGLGQACLGLPGAGRVGHRRLPGPALPLPHLEPLAVPGHRPEFRPVTSEMLGAIARATLACLTPTEWSWGGYVPSTIGEVPSQAPGSPLR